MMLRSILLALVFWSLSFPVAAHEQRESQLMAVFLGRFANYIKTPDKKPEHYTITILGENPFEEVLNRYYKDKKINHKKVQVRYIQSVDDIDQTDILFITLPSLKERIRAIEYAQKNHIITISDALGFAENGGIIQINFISQKAKIKINHAAAVQSQIKIAAPLLSIATVLEDRP